MKKHPLFYKLDENKKVVPATLEDYVILCHPDNFETHKLVRRDMCEETGTLISTVFMGMDQGLSAFLGGSPRFFESCVFGPRGQELGQHQYATWDEAVAGHERLCRVWNDKARGKSARG